jgi:hypothetical protein
MLSTFQVTSQKVAVRPRNMHFDFAKGVHLGRHRIGGLNFKNSSRCSSNSLKFLTPTDPLAYSPKWTMTLNQNTYCAQFIAGCPDFLRTY